MTWDECKAFRSYIRAAVKANLPPKQVIFNDPSHTEYDFWDLRLLKAYHFGEDESDRVNFEVKRRTSRSQAALDRAKEQDSKGNKKPVPGRYYVPVPKTNDGGALPTFDEWAKAQARLEGRK